MFHYNYETPINKYYQELAHTFSQMSLFCHFSKIAILFMFTLLKQTIREAFCLYNVL